MTGNLKIGMSALSQWKWPDSDQPVAKFGTVNQTVIAITRSEAVAGIADHTASITADNLVNCY